METKHVRDRPAAPTSEGASHGRRSDGPHAREGAHRSPNLQPDRRDDRPNVRNVEAGAGRFQQEQLRNHQFVRRFWAVGITFARAGMAVVAGANERAVASVEWADGVLRGKGGKVARFAHAGSPEHWRFHGSQIRLVEANRSDDLEEPNLSLA